MAHNDNGGVGKISSTSSHGRTHASLGICTLSVAENITSEIRPEGVCVCLIFLCCDIRQYSAFTALILTNVDTYQDAPFA